MVNENLFTAKADLYALSRPGYSPDAIAKIKGLLPNGGIMADIGSGSGIFAKEFFMHGYDVYCVEPNGAMRSEAEKRYSALPHFHSISATAESTSLPSNSISLVAAASSFQWLDADLFRLECKRILKDGGMACIIYNERIYDSFTQKQHELCKRFCHGYSSLMHGAEKTMLNAPAFFGGEYSLERFSFPLDYTKESFILRSLSSSYAPLNGAEENTAYVSALKDIMDNYFDDDNIKIANDTVMLWGRIS